MHGIVSRVTQAIGILRSVKRIFADTSVLLRCYFAFVFPILEYFSPVWGSAAECHLQLLERQEYSVVRLCPYQSFLSLCHRRRVAGLSMLYKVNLNSNHCLFSELPSDSTRVRHTRDNWSLKCQGVERPNLLDFSCRLRFDCGMTFPTLCLIPERWMVSRVQSTVGCFPELYFLQLSVAQVLVGLRKQFIDNFVFPTWACAADFKIIIMIIIHSLSTFFFYILYKTHSLIYITSPLSQPLVLYHLQITAGLSQTCHHSKL